MSLSNTVAYSGIVVGVDGSAPSLAAVRWAAREAAMRSVRLTLLHVMSSGTVGSPVAMWPAAPVPDELIRWQEDEARQILSASVDVAETQTGAGVIQVSAGVVRSAPVPTLVDVSKEAQLMVVGSRGQGAVRRVLLGSVSSGLVQHAHCPVAVIRAEMPEHTPEFAKLPVLVGVDGSRSAQRATAIAFDEASFRGVDLLALHAWSDGDVADIPTLELSAAEVSAEKVLAERLAGWQERYPDVNVRRTIVGDKPAGHLINGAESAQLIVVGSRGRGGFTGMLLGSVSRAVVNAVTTPVIVCR